MNDQTWEDSPLGWPQQRSNTWGEDGRQSWTSVSVWPAGRPIAQWSLLEAGRSDFLTVSSGTTKLRGRHQAIGNNERGGSRSW